MMVSKRIRFGLRLCELFFLLALIEHNVQYWGFVKNMFIFMYAYNILKSCPKTHDKDKKSKNVYLFCFVCVYVKKKKKEGQK